MRTVAKGYTELCYKYQFLSNGTNWEMIGNLFINITAKTQLKALEWMFWFTSGGIVNAMNLA